MYARDVKVTIAGQIIRQSAKAIKFYVEEISGTPVNPSYHWFPISQTEKVYKSTKDILVVTEWICKQKGLL